MDIRHFRHFLAVAEELHFGHAAHRLNMEQAPLSQSIQRLETRLGVSLFDRSRRGGTKLTPAGVSLIPEARMAVLQFERAVSVARRAGHTADEPVRIGFVTAAILKLLPSTIRAYSAAFAGARVQLFEGPTADLLNRVIEDQIDIALVHPVDTPPPGLVLSELKRDRTIVALPRVSPVAAKKSVTMADLADEPLIFFPRMASPDLYRHFMAYFKAMGVEPRIEQEARATPTILSLVSAGLGYAFVQESARSLPFHNVVFRPLKDAPPQLSWRLSLAWKPSVATEACCNFVSQLRPLAGGRMPEGDALPAEVAE